MRELLARCGLATNQVIAIGMGVPGPVDFESGQLVNPPLMPEWDGFSIRDYLCEAFAAPVFVDNDVNLMAEAMRWKGGQGPRAVCGCLGFDRSGPERYTRMPFQLSF